MARRGGPGGLRGRHGRRGLDRQDRRRGAGPGERRGHEAPRLARRHGPGRSGAGADRPERHGRPATAPASCRLRGPRAGWSWAAARATTTSATTREPSATPEPGVTTPTPTDLRLTRRARRLSRRDGHRRDAGDGRVGDRGHRARVARRGGQQVSEGDTVIEVSTDKIDAEVPAPTSGTITKLLVSPDDTVQVGQALGRDDGGAGGAPTAPAESEPAPAAPADSGNGRASPVARRVAAAKGVDLAGIKGSGPSGKVTKEDVLAAAGNGASATAAPAAAETKPLRGPAAIRQGDGREPLDPDRDLVPHASGRRPRRQAQGTERSAQGARDEGLLHPPDRLGDRQGRDRVAGDGPQLHRGRRQAARRRAGRRRTSGSRSTSSARTARAA